MQNVCTLYNISKSEVIIITTWHSVITTPQTHCNDRIFNQGCNLHHSGAYLLHQNKGGKTWDTASHKDVKETL